MRLSAVLPPFLLIIVVGFTYGHKNYQMHLSRSSRHLLSVDWMDATALVNEPRAPLLMKFTSDLRSDSRGLGVCGVCTKVYRVLFRTGESPVDDCRPYHNSKQSGFGDITNFYHILSKSGRLNDTLEFPLADEFPKFSFRFSIMYLPSRRSEPGLLIETGSQTKHVLCVQSINCPEPVTPPTTIPIMNSHLSSDSSVTHSSTMSSFPTTNSVSIPRDIALIKPMRSADIQTRQSTNEFWDTLLSGTEPKSWFLATISLACISLLLIIILVATWIYVCRMKKFYRRRSCRGTCRFGCRCPPELVRQTVADAAVCGPLGLPNQQPFTNAISPQGNGSLRSGSGFANAIYGGGTLTSNRWGSNGHKLGSPLYVAMSGSMANAIPDKTPLIQPGCATPNCLLDGVGIIPSNNSIDESWSQRNGHFRATRLRSKKSSQDALHHSASEGSTVSEITTNNLSNTHDNNRMKNPNTSVYQHRTGQTVSFTDDLSVNMTTGMIVSNHDSISQQQQHQHLTDKLGNVYLQGGLSGYTYSDHNHNRELSTMSPVTAYSPTRIGGRKSNDQFHYMHNRIGMDAVHDNDNNDDATTATTNNNSGNINATEVDTVNVENQIGHLEMSYLSYNNKRTPGLLLARCTEKDNYDSAINHHQLVSHLNHGSEGDGLDITPPSGFYDFNTTTPEMSNNVPTSTSSVVVSSTLTGGIHNLDNANPIDENANSIYHLDVNRCMNPYNPVSQSRIANPISFSRQSFISPLHPILGSPTSQSSLSAKHPKSPLGAKTTDNVLSSKSVNGQMVGCLDEYYQTENVNSEVMMTGVDKLTRFLNSGGIRPVIARPSLYGASTVLNSK